MCPSERRRPGTLVLVLTLLALLAGTALYLRSWRLDYDRIHPDDPKQILAAREFIRGDYLFGIYSRNSDIRGYPYFAMHLVEWTYRGYVGVLSHVSPGIPTPREALDDRQFDIFLRRIGLLLNCLYEFVALGLVFLVGRRLFDPWVGLAAAGVFAVSSLHIQATHMIGADLPGSLFVFGVFFFCARLRDRERLGDWFGAGVCAGLAAAAKYNGLLSLLAPALVFLELRLREGWRTTLSPRRIRGPLVVFAAFAAAFALATPSLLLAPKSTIDAIQSVLLVVKEFRIPEEFVGRRIAWVASLWYSHLNNFLRFFEPLPGWLTLTSLGVFVARRRLRESFLWIYPLVLFPIAAYSFPVSVAYHYLCVFLPLTWVIGFAAVEMLRAMKKTWLQVPAAVLLGGWALLAAVSDTAVFTLPTATKLAARWLVDCAEPDRFELASPQEARKQIYPRMFGVDFEDFSSSARAERELEAVKLKPVVAVFDLETRSPTLNHIRNRPHWIRWRDGRERDVELFPPPRRVGGSRKELVFPENLVLGRSATLMTLTAGADGCAPRPPGAGRILVAALCALSRAFNGSGQDPSAAGARGPLADAPAGKGRGVSRRPRPAAHEHPVQRPLYHGSSSQRRTGIRLARLARGARLVPADDGALAGAGGLGADAAGLEVRGAACGRQATPRRRSRTERRRRGRGGAPGIQHR